MSFASHAMACVRGQCLRAGTLVVLAALLVSGCASGGLTTREQGAGLGAAIGAGTGAIIGSQKGHAGKGAIIGAALGGLGGAVVGDQVQAGQQQNNALRGRLDRQQQELAQNRELLRKLRARNVDAAVGRRGVVVTLPDVLFEFGSAKLTGSAVRTISNIAQIINSDAPNRAVSVEGHTDSVGPADYNQSLSERRAAAVSQALISFQVDGRRLAAKGLGEGFPVAPNTKANGSDNPQGRARNRRVEIVILNSAA